MSHQAFRSSFYLSQIHEVAAGFLPVILSGKICTFSGDPGAGKTTFIHALCDQLGVTDAVSSPTFALLNEYHFTQNSADRLLYHMDWYRLRDAAEAVQAGMEDALLQPGAYCWIEWPERAPELLSKPHISIAITVTGADTRELVLHLPEA